MKIIAIFIYLLISTLDIYSQDFIILKNNDTIKCKIIEDKVSFIFYKLINSPDTVTLKINQADYDYYIIKSDILPDYKSSAFYNTNIPEVKKIYKKGVYLTFQQLVNDSPSFNSKFEIIKRTESDIKLMGGNDYKIVSLSDSLSNSTIRKAWVICDGKDCYINSQQFSQYRFYCILTFENNYAYFSSLPFDRNNINNLSFSGGAIGGAISGAAAALERTLYKIYLKNGKIERY